MLSKVAGGTERRARTVTVPVTLPNDRVETIVLEVYVDGVLNSSYTKTLDPYVVIINISFKGTQGKISVNVKINNQTYKTYVVDFDNGTYNCL